MMRALQRWLEQRPEMARTLSYRALHRIDPDAAVSRKSGSWSTYHSDSVLVERDGHRYIAVVLADGAKGSTWLGQIITRLDEIVTAKGVPVLPAKQLSR